MKERGVVLVMIVVATYLGAHFDQPVGTRGYMVADAADRPAVANPELSAEWLLIALAEEGRLTGDPLTESEVRMLRTPIQILAEGGAAREQSVVLNNKVVRLARSAMQRAKAAGVPTVEARRNLRIPADWFRHYTVIFTNNLDWFLSGTLQNAMLENPVAGETTPWESK